MIKIGLFIDSYYPMVDGVTTVVHNYAKRLNDGEFQTTVFCPVESYGYVDSFDYRVERCKSYNCSFLDYRAPAPRSDAKFCERLENSELDIVHIHSPFAVGAIGSKYAKKHGIPVIATLHSQYKKDLFRATHSRMMTALLVKKMVRLFDSCDRCYAVNEAVADIFTDYGVKTRPAVLKNCTDYLPAENRDGAGSMINEKFGIPESVPVFMFLGRMTKLKNVFFMIDAVSRLNDIDFRLIAVGDGKDLPALKRYTHKLGMGGKVIFPGKILDTEILKALFCRSKLFLFPSMYDSSSIVQIEAASQSLPTVFLTGAATATGITDGVNGFLSPPDPAAYAAKIRAILADETVYNAVRLGAFRDLYRTWDDAIDEIKNIYRGLVKN